MRKRTNDTAKRRAFLIRSLIYGTLGILLFAAAVSSSQLPGSFRLGDIAYIEGHPVAMTGYGLVVDLDSTGDGSHLTHTDKSLSATLAHLEIDPQGYAVATGKVAAVLVQAEFYPGSEIGMTTRVRVTALNDATGLSGGRLLPLSLASRDGRFFGTTTGFGRVVVAQSSKLAPAQGVIERELVCHTPVFMNEVPGQDFILEARGLSPSQVAQLCDRINQSFGEIANTHTGCDIEVRLPQSYSDYAERASLVLQIAALPVDDIVPALLVDHQDGFTPGE